MAKELGFLAVIVTILTIAIGSAVGLAMVSYTGTVYTNLGVATYNLLAKQESYITGNDTTQTVNGTTAWAAQTFTLSTTAHTVTSVKLLLYRVGTPGTAAINITAVDGSYKPTGANLTIGSFDADAITEDTDGEWVEIPVTEYQLTASTQYAIVLTAVSGDTDNYIKWHIDAGGGTTTGSLCTTLDGGSTWTVTASDALFEVWGNTVEDTAAGASFNSVTNIVYTSWPLLGLAVLALIGAAVLASIIIFKP